MDIQKIKQLIDLLAHSDLSEIELVEGEHRLRLVRRAGHVAADASGTLAEASSLVARGATAPARSDEEARPAATARPVATHARLSRVVSPMHGVLHLTPSPNEPAYVAIGEQVLAGQTLCTVEAMKMFHEVKADHAGEVVAILADAGEEVEAGQALFQLADRP
jgi:acetyl-CoA carboxylase biotin carboxyl carrier protein